MFAKKLLSIVSTLFIGSQLLSFANATALTGCNTLTLTNDGSLDEVTNGCTFGETSYCLSGNSIYGYTSGDGNTATCIINKEGTYVLLGDAKLGESATVSDNVNNLKIYQCTGVSTVKCKQTFGYVLNNEQYLEISASGTNRIRTDGAAIDTLTALGITDCTVGEIYDNESGAIQLCLIGGDTDIYSQGIAEITIKSYILNNVQGNVFTNVAGGNGDENKPIVVNVGNGKIILSTSGYDYCAASNSEVIETFNGFCSETPENDPCSDNPYECADTGICSREVSVCKIKDGASPNCQEGYYIVNETVDEENVYVQKTTAGEVGVLYKCNGSYNCEPATSGFKVGYYVNKAVGDVPYIKCSAQDNCEAVGVSANCDNVGSIINDGGYKICLDVGVSSGLLNTASGDHFINVDTAIQANSEDVFEAVSGDYAKITITEGNIALATAVEVGNAKKYIYTDGTYKIYSKAQKDNVCGVSEGTLVEFKLDADNSDSNSFYKKHAENKRPQHD